jgi:hypothetical protein
MTVLTPAFTKTGDVRRGLYNRLSDIKIPVLVAQEHSDVMISTANSYQLSQKLPNARFLIYPNWRLGFLF